MPITFRSSTPDSITIIQREGDRQRVAVATKNPTATRFWNLHVEHPSGETWPGTYTGNANDVVVALGTMLAKTEHEWVSGRSRGDRPPTRTLPDRSVRVLDGYDNPVIRGYSKG